MSVVPVNLHLTQGGGLRSLGRASCKHPLQSIYLAIMLYARSIRTGICLLGGNWRGCVGIGCAGRFAAASTVTAARRPTASLERERARGLAGSPADFAEPTRGATRELKSRPHPVHGLAPTITRPLSQTMEKSHLLDLESQPPLLSPPPSPSRRALKARLAHLALTALIITAIWLYSPPSDNSSDDLTPFSTAHDWSHLFYAKQCPGVQPISTAEFSARRDKLAGLLRGEDGSAWGAYVSEPGPNTLYYANLTDGDWYLSERPWLVAISPGPAGAGARAEVSVLTPAFEKSRSQRLPFALTKEEYTRVHWVTWEEAEDPYAILVKHLDGLREQAGATGEWRIELEENVRTFVGTGLGLAGKQLEGDWPEVGLASIAVREQRMRKTAAELDIQRCAAKVKLRRLSPSRHLPHVLTPPPAPTRSPSKPSAKSAPSSAWA